MPYNVKVIKYPTGNQVRFYSETVGLDTYKKIDDELYLEYYDNNGNLHIVTLDSETGRCSPDVEYSVNPFTGEYERIRSFADVEHSQRVSRNRTLNNLYYDTRSNVWDWFVTLTFDPKKVNRYDYDECTKRLHSWLTVCRRTCPDMKYILVPEMHKDEAFHFHGLFANCDTLAFIDSGKKDGSGRVIYNLGKYKLGYTTATVVDDSEKTSYYMTKYITKDLCAATFGKKRYWKSRNLSKAEIVTLSLNIQDKEELLQAVTQVAQYHKTVDGYLTTDYFEMSQEFDISLVDVHGEVI